MARKRKSSPPMDALSRGDKEQKRQHLDARQKVRTLSAVDEEFASQTRSIAGVCEDSWSEDPDIQGSEDSLSTELPKYLDPLQRIRPTYYPI